MSAFGDPFDPRRPLRLRGCSCGAHRSEIEHAAAVRLEPQERLTRVVEGAVMRALFPKDNTRRAFLTAVGASTALAAVAQFLPIGAATDAFAQGGTLEKKGPKGRLHPDHLRDADHHGGADGLLYEAGPERGGGQDRWLGRYPRQDAQQGIRRRAHAVVGLGSFAPFHINVNVVCPGAIRTRAHDRLPPEVIDKVRYSVPMGYIAEPSDVAAVVAFLASDDARYITGQSLLIDGGRWMI
jgi:hypothetical protein